MNALPLRSEFFRRHFIGHPTIGESRHAAQPALHRGARRAGAVFPGKARGIAGDPDRHGILHGAWLDRDAFELVEATFVRCFFLVKELAKNGDAFFKPAHALRIFDAHHFVFERLRGALLVGPAQTDCQPRSAI